MPEASAKRVVSPFLMASYEGNPDGVPIYPGEADHGYTDAVSGGSDVMQDLVGDLRKEQGNPRLAASPHWSAPWSYSHFTPPDGYYVEFKSEQRRGDGNYEYANKYDSKTQYQKPYTKAEAQRVLRSYLDLDVRITVVEGGMSRTSDIYAGSKVNL